MTVARKRRRASIEKTYLSGMIAKKISMATQNGIDLNKPVCNTFNMTEEKFTTEQILTMASKLGIEVTGSEITEKQKEELAFKLTALFLIANK